MPRFYTDMEATLGVWDGKQFIPVRNGVETDDKKFIALLRKAGLREEPTESEKSEE